jgi:hypothetical protein
MYVEVMRVWLVSIPCSSCTTVLNTAAFLLGLQHASKQQLKILFLNSKLADMEAFIAERANCGEYWA